MLEYACKCQAKLQFVVRSQLGHIPKKIIYERDRILCTAYGCIRHTSPRCITTQKSLDEQPPRLEDVTTATQKHEDESWQVVKFPRRAGLHKKYQQGKPNKNLKQLGWPKNNGTLEIRVQGQTNKDKDQASQRGPMKKPLRPLQAHVMYRTGQHPTSTSLH